MVFNTDMTVKDWADQYGLTTPVIDDNRVSMGKFGSGAFPSYSLFGPGHVLLYQGSNWKAELEKELGGE